MTLILTVISIFFGIVVGLALALMQQGRFKTLQKFSLSYLWLIRGTPVLFQLIFIFNVLPTFGLLFSGFTCAVLALSLNEGAYEAEIMRSGIQAIRQRATGCSARLRAQGMASDALRSCYRRL